MTPVFVDTSALAAAINPKDQYHDPVRRWFEEPENWRLYDIYTSFFVLDELITLLTRRKVPRSDIIDRIEYIFDRESGWTVLEVNRLDWNEAWKIYKQYTDQQFSMTDCTSFALMRRFNIQHALAVDKDFLHMQFIPVLSF